MCGCVSCRTIKAKKQAEPKASSERVPLRDRKRGKDTGGEGEGQSAPSTGKKKKVVRQMLKRKRHRHRKNVPRDPRSRYSHVLMICLFTTGLCKF